MILQKMLNLFSKTYDLIKVINLFSKTYDFIKNTKFVNKKRKGVISEKKYFRWFAVSTCPLGQVLASPDMNKS